MVGHKGRVMKPSDGSSHVVRHRVGAAGCRNVLQHAAVGRQLEQAALEG